MIEKKIIEKLLKKSSPEDVERHLIWLFLTKNHLNFKESQYLNNYIGLYNGARFNYANQIELQDIKKLENYLELIIPKNDRKVNGAFFTPTYIVDFIINEVAPMETDKCLDPSCGCGAFLIGLVDYYKKKYNKNIKQIIKENIYGSDILDYNVRRAKIVLLIYGLLHNEIIEEADFNIYHQDSLNADWKNDFEIIVGNPPYVKYQDLSGENRNHLIKNWKSIENGTFNLYFAFFELGHKLLTPKGKLGYITPNNYFTSLAGLSLRQYFLQKK